MSRKKKKKNDGAVVKALKNSPINYFSDLFIVVMVLGWAIILFIMVAMAIYTTLVLFDTSMWSYVESLVVTPLSAGGAIWMIKNSVQHAIANSHGVQAHMDFPAVNADGEWDGQEQPLFQTEDTNTEENDTEEHG